MSVNRYNIEFHDDGTSSSTPASPSITPGTSITINGQAKQVNGTVFLPIDLTNATLIAALIDGSGKIRLYQTGSPALTITNALRGKFTLILPPLLTQILKPGESHTLEIKAVYANGDRQQICYTPISVAASALISE